MMTQKKTKTVRVGKWMITPNCRRAHGDLSVADEAWKRIKNQVQPILNAHPIESEIEVHFTVELIKPAYRFGG